MKLAQNEVFGWEDLVDDKDENTVVGAILVNEGTGEIRATITRVPDCPWVEVLVYPRNLDSPIAMYRTLKEAVAAVNKHNNWVVEGPEQKESNEIDRE